MTKIGYLLDAIRQGRKPHPKYADHKQLEALSDAELELLDRKAFRELKKKRKDAKSQGNS